jgi:hypothetical protein
MPSQSLDMLEKAHNISGIEFDRKKLTTLGNFPKNTIKHFDNLDDRYTILEPKFDSFLQLSEAFVEHKRLNRPVTENIIKFEAYIIQTKKQGKL